MKPPPDKVDKYGFPIPPTFDTRESSGGSGGRWGRKAWRRGLLVVFAALLAGGLFRARLLGKGGEAMARWLADRAEKRIWEGDWQGAVADLDRAISWAPRDAKAYELRGRAKLEARDLEGSLADYNRAVQLAPRYAPAYTGRSLVLQRLHRYPEAIRDSTTAIKLRPESDPEPLNNRAYARAIAGIELEEGLADVERALELESEGSSSYAAYLDTRGYLLYLLGRIEPALADLERAVDIVETEKQQVLSSPEARRADPRVIARLTQFFDHNLAVMYHHRGEVHAKLGHVQAASADLGRGDQLGYNPANGVY